MTIPILIISGCMIVFALGLTIISLLSYREYRNKKLLFVSIVFILLLAKGGISLLSIFLDQLPQSPIVFYSGLIDLGILILLYLATLKS